MSIAGEIENLNTNLQAAKSAVTAKGGTVGDTGLAGLAEEIAGIACGAVKILTADDYNFPANNPEYVALWLLDDGLYGVASGTSVLISGSEVRNPEQVLFAVNEVSGIAMITVLNGSPDEKMATYVVDKTTGTQYESGWVLRNTMVIDSLTSTYTDSPLSANQGKVLNEKIDGRVKAGSAPTSATVGTLGQLYEDTTNGKLYQCTEINDSATPIVYIWREMATLEQVSWRQRKPVVVWEVDGTTVTTGLVGVNEDISANPNWQLTDLDLTPYKRIKIFSKAAQKAGSTASASTTPAIILEMSLDPRAAIAEYGGNYVASNVVQKPNDPNRLCTLCCAVSADKTKFEVLRMTNLYGTAATSNSDVGAYVFKIEGYYD